ncbi:MAG: dihydroorotate dehydrogenase electron transfer subunit [Candidatus Aenigmatarchaeota archaeon]
MYEVCKIIDVVDEAKNVRTFFLDKKIDAMPGQFVMVWLPGINEKPFSLSYENGITVKMLGPFTKSLFDLHIGDKLWIRGPYGNSFIDFVGDSKKYLIAGGTGAAPLAFFAEWLNEKPTVILGARSKDGLVFADRFRKKSNLLITTNDGSCGSCGFVTDLVKDDDAQFFICGPEKMMLACVQKIKTPENIILSLERYMKCGCGICGNCELSGLRVCKDGPIFRYSAIVNSDFGRSKRNEIGKMVSV